MASSDNEAICIGGSSTGGKVEVKIVVKFYEHFNIGYCKAC